MFKVVYNLVIIVEVLKESYFVRSLLLKVNLIINKCRNRNFVIDRKLGSVFYF